MAQLVSGTPNASSLYQNPIWSSNAMPTFGLFIPNVTSHIPVQIVVISTFHSGETDNFSLHVCKFLSLSIKWRKCTTSLFTVWGKNPKFPLISSGTHVSGSQPHMVGVSQPNLSGIPNLIDPSRVGNILFQ